MKFLPITEWLPQYQRPNLPGDVIAGVALAGLLIPEAMGYAGIAGLPPQAGLYATVFGLLAYAIFGTSRQLVVSPTSASSAILAATLAPLAAAAPGKFALLASAVTLVLGGLFLLAGILKLGFVADFISKPVLKGFVFGVALSIIIKQLPKLLGVAPGTGHAYNQLFHALRQLGGTHLWTLAAGLTALVVLFLVDRFAPRIPGALVVLAGGIAASRLLGLHDQGVEIVGHIPAGLPLPGFPVLTWADWLQAAPASVGLVLVLFAESIGAARTFAAKNGYDIDANQELRALGFSNAASAIFRGMQVGGGTSGTAANDANGAQSQLSSIAASATVALTLLFLTGWFYYLPQAILAAIVIHAVWHLLDYRALAQFRRISRIEYRESLAAIFGVVAFDILNGLVLAVLLTLIALMRFLLVPQVVVLGRLRETGEYAEIARHPEAEEIPGVLILRVDRIWFFANANGIRDHAKDLIRQAPGPLHTVIVNLAPVQMIDVTAVDVLAQLHASSVKHGWRLVLAGVRDPVRDTLERSGLLRAIGRENVFRSVALAVESATSAPHPV
ncbi:MAG TPA: SulP family inorganic anion transporter [Candidatus Eisenbacteria bacterium]|nr:SulP family inorganic anion transporter [Candidatus Eisenbacteria bacterium]